MWSSPLTEAGKVEWVYFGCHGASYSASPSLPLHFPWLGLQSAISCLSHMSHKPSLQPQPVVNRITGESVMCSISAVLANMFVFVIWPLLWFLPTFHCNTKTNIIHSAFHSENQLFWYSQLLKLTSARHWKFRVNCLPTFKALKEYIHTPHVILMHVEHKKLV